MIDTSPPPDLAKAIQGLLRSPEGGKAVADVLMGNTSTWHAQLVREHLRCGGETQLWPSSSGSSAQHLGPRTRRKL